MIDMPKKTPSSTDFSVDDPEWKGYVVRALEDIDKEIREIKDAINDIGDKHDESINKVYKRLNNLSSLVNKIEIKLGTISAGIAIVISLVISNLDKII